MSTNTVSLSSHVKALWFGRKSWLQELTLIVAGSLLLAFSAQISIPLQPIPLTFQSVTALLLGALMGPRRGTAAIALYLLEGAAGLPVFANFNSGFAVFLAPTAGYLLGFLPAVFCTGYLVQKGWARNLLTSFISVCIGDAIIFTFGVLALTHFIGIHNAITYGLLPFVVTETVKLMALAVFINKVKAAA